ncbi:MAG: outer membrane protein assembly factor BamC [Usitatibacter sp.]
MNRLKLLAVPAALVLLAGCSPFGKKSEEYKGAQARAVAPLEVPPELTAPSMDDRYSIPDPRAQTAYSAYSQKPTAAAAPEKPAVLPKFEGVRLERFGDQRWLVVKGEPEKVWPVAREFWIDNGFQLLREEPQLGIIETDWHEDRSKIPQDLIRRTIGRFIEGVYSYPRRDKYRTRLEKGVEPGTTEIFVSNRNVEEVYSSSTQDRTMWQAQPADRDLEAEMLSKLMVKIGGGDTTVTTASAPVPGRRGVTPTPVSMQPRNAVLENNGAGPLVVNDSFDRAWRRVGLALDRVGFTVEDRDRSKGIFFVRYIDPDADLKNTNEGWLNKLQFWKAPPRSAQPQYRIHVADAGASMSQVQVQDSKGAPEASSTGKKILGLLFEQLK